MRNFGSRNTVKDWARLAAKLGLLLTEPKVRSAIANQVRDRADAVTETIADKYEDALIVWKRPEPRYRVAPTGRPASRASYWV